jgi:hypothetical protein
MEIFEEKSELVAGCIFLALAWRLFSLSLRTRQAPERLMTIAFFT